MATIPLVGPSYTSRSIAAECQRTVNWYIEAIESGAGPAPAVLYPTPGLRHLGVAPAGGRWRGLWRATNNQVYGVVGDQFYELTSLSLASPVVDAVALQRRGAVVDDGRPVVMADNGVHGGRVCIASGGRLSIYTQGNADHQFPAMAIAPVTAVTFIDGYFIAISPTTVQLSENGVTWDPTDISGRGEGADPFVTGIQNHRELWLLGEVTSEVWYDSGNADFPFQPIPGVFIEVGICAASSLVRLDQTVAWLAQTREGDRLAVIAEQYQPKRVSTHAMEVTWRKYPRVDDAVSYSYQEDGHTYWVLTFPTAGATWVYDAATQLWHERGHWNRAQGVYEAHRANCHAWAWGRHLVGDRASANLYALDSLTFSDQLAEGDTPIRRVRRLPHLASEQRQVRHSHLEIDLEMGLGLAVGQGKDPRAMLRWSDDRGHTWTSEWWVDASIMGTYAARAEWSRLGVTRDRVYEVATSDPIPWRLMAAYLTADGGRG